MEDNNRKVSSNLIWRFLERFGAQGVTFVVSIILARILDPTIYGTIAITIIVTTILQVFIDSGLGTALVQKKNADDADFSTVFYFNLFLCTVLYVGLFFFAPLISAFFEKEELTDIIRVLGILLIISGFKNVQNSYVSRNLLFKKYFFATLGGTVTAAVVGIWMAYNGYGVWALVIQNLVNQTIDTIILWIIVKWRPKLSFSFTRLKILFSYGWKLLVSSLLNTIWTEARGLIIGKKYSSENLAHYNKGEEYPKYATSALNSSIDSVLFPVMAKAQDEPEKVKAMTRRAIKVSSFCLFPMMIGLAVCAKPLVQLILTDKWLPCVPYLQIFCLSYAFHPIHNANLNAIKAMGRSDYFLILEVIKKVVDAALILIGMWLGVIWLAIGVLISNAVSQIVNSFPNIKLIRYSFFQQFLDIVPAACLSIVMGVLVFSISLFNLPPYVSLIIQIPLGIIVYIGGAILLKNDSLKYVVYSVKNLFSRKKENNEQDTEVRL